MYLYFNDVRFQYSPVNFNNTQDKKGLIPDSRRIILDPKWLSSNNMFILFTQRIISTAVWITQKSFIDK